MGACRSSLPPSSLPIRATRPANVEHEQCSVTAVAAGESVIVNVSGTNTYSDTPWRPDTTETAGELYYLGFRMIEVVIDLDCGSDHIETT